MITSISFLLLYCLLFLAKAFCLYKFKNVIIIKTKITKI
jgi:hypothetical protein